MPLVEPEPPSSNAVGNRSHITRTHDLEQSVVNLRAKSDGNAASSFTFTGVSCATCLSCSHRLYKEHLINRFRCKGQPQLTPQHARFGSCPRQEDGLVTLERFGCWE